MGMSLGIREVGMWRWGGHGPLGEKGESQGLDLWREKFTNKVSSRLQDAMGGMLLRGLMSCPGRGEASTRESLGETELRGF